MKNERMNRYGWIDKYFEIKFYVSIMTSKGRLKIEYMLQCFIIKFLLLLNLLFFIKKKKITKIDTSLKHFKSIEFLQ